jgi:hypothetical protein
MAALNPSYEMLKIGSLSGRDPCSWIPGSPLRGAPE